MRKQATNNKLGNILLSENQFLKSSVKEAIKYIDEKNHRDEDFCLMDGVEIKNILLKKNINKDIESTFIYKGQNYNAFELIYKLADDGMFELEHNNFEEKGVKIIL